MTLPLSSMTAEELTKRYLYGSENTPSDLTSDTLKRKR